MLGALYQMALVGISLALGARNAHSQRLAPGWQAVPPATIELVSTSRPWRPSRVRPSIPAGPRRTYALEGAVLGGIAVGFLGAVVGLGFCHFDAPCRHPFPFVVGGAVLGGAAGAALGARLGGAVPRHRLGVTVRWGRLP